MNFVDLFEEGGSTQEHVPLMLDSPSPSQQPPHGLQSPALANHRQMQRNAGNLAYEHWRIIFFWVSLVFSLVQLAITSVVLVVDWSKPCDAPLKGFLLAYGAAIVLHLGVMFWYYRTSDAQEFYLDDTFDLDQRTSSNEWREATREASNIFTLVLYVLGNLWVFSCETCQKTAPALYYLSLAWVLYGYTVLLVPLTLLMLILFCMPLFILIMRFFYPAERRGATDALIQTLPEYHFTRAGDDIGTSGVCLAAEDAECAICLAAYDANQPLRIFTCKHHFHKDCVDRWLAISANCPLCVQPIFPRRRDGPLASSSRYQADGGLNTGTDDVNSVILPLIAPPHSH